MNQLLYVKESELPTTRTRKEFLRKFILNGGYDTYSDKECKNLQCSRKSENGSNNSYRSVTELNAILRSRFKLTSLKGTVKLIREIINEEENVILVWCNMINKCVVKYVRNTPKNYISDVSRNNYYTRKGVDGYSLKDFEDMYKSL